MNFIIPALGHVLLSNFSVPFAGHWAPLYGHGCDFDCLFVLFFLMKKSLNEKFHLPASPHAALGRGGSVPRSARWPRLPPFLWRCPWVLLDLYCSPQLSLCEENWMFLWLKIKKKRDILYCIKAVLILQISAANKWPYRDHCYAVSPSRNKEKQARLRLCRH